MEGSSSTSPTLLILLTTLSLSKHTSKVKVEPTLTPPLKQQHHSFFLRLLQRLRSPALTNYHYHPVCHTADLKVSSISSRFSIKNELHYCTRSSAFRHCTISSVLLRCTRRRTLHYCTITLSNFIHELYYCTRSSAGHYCAGSGVPYYNTRISCALYFKQEVVYLIFVQEMLYFIIKRK